MVIEVVVGALVLVGVVEVFCSVRMGVRVGGVRNRGGGVVRGGGNASVTDGGADGGGAGGGGGGLGREMVAGSPMGFSENSGKTSHIVVHSRSISAISFCRLACKKELV